MQYRAKNADVALRHEQGSELLALCHAYGAPLIINDDLRLADLIEADGLHIGRDDAGLQEARLILGPERMVGVSCYASLDGASMAAANGADYVAFGSFFSSPTKPGAPPAPPSILTGAKTTLETPVVAIGGITLENAPSLIQAGADALAVISGLFESPDIQGTAEAFTELFH